MGNCRDCAHWAFMDKTLGECTLSELARADSLHVAVVYISDDGFAYHRTDDQKYSAVLETDAAFGCVSFEPKQAE